MESRSIRTSLRAACALAGHAGRSGLVGLVALVGSVGAPSGAAAQAPQFETPFQVAMRLGVIPNADGARVSFWAVPERVVDHEGPVECRYTLEANGQQWQHVVPLATGYDGVDLGSYCMISFATAFPEVPWPLAQGVRLEGEVAAVGAFTEPAFGTAVTLGAAQLSSRQAVLDALAGFGDAHVGEASQYYEEHRLWGPSYTFEVEVALADGGAIRAIVTEGAVGFTDPVGRCLAEASDEGPRCTVRGASHFVGFDIVGRAEVGDLSTHVIDALSGALRPAAASAAVGEGDGGGDE
jgi:hypothetical protein